MPAKIPYLLLRQGRYYARITVPNRIRKAIGRSELRQPLGADRREAIRRLPAAVAGFRDRLAEAERECLGRAVHRPERLMSLDEIAKAHFDARMESDSAGRNSSHVWASLPFDERYVKALRRVQSGAASSSEMNEVVGSMLVEWENRGAISAPTESSDWRTFARAIATAELEAIRIVAERDDGNHAVEPLDALFKEAAQERNEPLSFGALFDRYVAELKRSGGRGDGARLRWKSVFESLKSFLTHDDAHQLTRSEVLRWKVHLEEKLSPKTIRDSYIGGLRAVLQSAVEADLLSENVAKSIKVRVARRSQNREQGFTAGESVALLRAAVTYTAPFSANPATREGEHMSAAKRWVVPLCAYTGARVAEIAQLRKEDFQNTDGFDFIRIAPSAGSVKSDHYRDVPLHRHLVELGLIDFVKCAPNGPLFFADVKRVPSAQHGSKTVSQRLAKWVRSLNIVSLEVDPAHGWRHRFKSISLELDLNFRIIDAIQGHAARTAGEKYGNVSMVAKAREIERFPRIF